MSRLPPVPFAEAIAWAISRKVVLPDEYYGELQGIARALAFSVAKLSSLDQVQAIADSLSKAMENGESFNTWKKKVQDLDLGLSNGRLDNIFRTNLQGHYNAGRCRQQHEVVDQRPYLMYDAINDSRTRPAHAAMDGFVAPADDPIWATWRTPNGYRCRCRLIALTEKQGKRFMQVDQGRLDRDPALRSARQLALDGGPDEGWNYDICGHATKGVEQAVDKRKSPAIPPKNPKPLPKEKVAKIDLRPWAKKLNKSANERDLAMQWVDTAFIAADKEIKDIVAKTASKFRGMELESTGEAGYYSEYKRITMGDLSPNINGQCIMRHEYGHLVDDVLGGAKKGQWASNTGPVLNAFEKDAASIKKTWAVRDDPQQTADRAVQMGKWANLEAAALRNELMKECADMGFDYIELEAAIRSSMVAEGAAAAAVQEAAIKVVSTLKHRSNDLFKAMEGRGQSASFDSGNLAHISDSMAATTNNEWMGCASHSEEYWVSENMNQTNARECFANYFGAMSDPNPFWRKLHRYMMPEFTSAVDKILGIAT